MPTSMPARWLPRIRLRRGRLARRRARVVVCEAERQQHLPARLRRQPAQPTQVARHQHAARPRRNRGAGVAPRHTGVGGRAAEAQHAGPERAQQVDEVAAVGVLADLGGARELEGQSEEVARHRVAGRSGRERYRHRRRPHAVAALHSLSGHRCAQRDDDTQRHGGAAPAGACRLVRPQVSSRPSHRPCSKQVRAPPGARGLARSPGGLHRQAHVTSAAWQAPAPLR